MFVCQLHSAKKYLHVKFGKSVRNVDVKAKFRKNDNLLVINCPFIWEWTFFKHFEFKNFNKNVETKWSGVAEDDARAFEPVVDKKHVVDAGWNGSKQPCGVLEVHSKPNWKGTRRGEVEAATDRNWDNRSRLWLLHKNSHHFGEDQRQRRCR